MILCVPVTLADISKPLALIICGGMLAPVVRDLARAILNARQETHSHYRSPGEFDQSLRGCNVI